MATKKIETKEEKVDLTKIKEELTDYVNKQITKEIASVVDKSNKRLIREKNKKILNKNIIIIILLAIIGFLLFLLYDDNYFDKYFNNDKETKVVEKVDKDEKEEEKVKEPTLDELKEEYGYLLDNINISKNSKYIDDYYDANLSQELKNYLAFNNLDLDKLSIEDDYNIIENEELEKEYSKLFDDTYKAKSFTYNNVVVRYISKMESYITDELLEKEEDIIEKEITDIKVEDDKIIITTKEDNNKLIYTFKDNTLIKLDK